jgi:hypothetical protein
MREKMAAHFKQPVERKNEKLLILGAFVLSATSQAAELNGVPTSWKIENYIPSNVALWFTGSLCANGALQIPATATEDDKSRLYATIMNAKIAGLPVYISYEPSPNCQIQSFALSAQ